MITDADLLSQHQQQKRISLSGLSRQYKNTKTCQAFYAGDTMDLTGKVAYRDGDGEQKFVLCQFNHVKPYVNATRGFFLQTSNRVKYAARSNKELEAFYTDYANSYHDYCRDNARADQIEAKQDLDMLVNGYGITDTFLSFGVGYASRDPNGEIGMMRLDPNKYWWDPSARETNLIDRKWDGYSKEYRLEEAKDLFDAGDDEFEKQLQDAEGEYEYNPSGGVKNLIRNYYDFVDFEDRIINVDFYQWVEIQTYYRGYNPLFDQVDPEAVLNIKAFMDMVKEETGDDDFDPKAEIISCSEETKEKLNESLDIEFSAFKRNCFYSAVISGKKVFTKYKSISQDGFTRKVKTGDFDEKNKIWVGMVNAMIEPQKYFNKSITEFLYTIAYAAKGGVMYEEDAIDDIREFEANYAKPNTNVEVAAGALMEGRIKPKREPFMPTGIEQIIQLSSSSFEDVSGLPQGFLGTAESGLETAALQRQRIRQAINTLACYVDSITLYKKEHARLMLDLMRELASFGGDRQFRLISEGQSELAPVKPDHLVDEYDIDIEEAPESEVEKAERVDSLASMGTLYMTAGDINRGSALFALAIEDMPLPADKKAKAIEAIAPKEIDPMQVQMLERRVQELQAIIQSGQMEKTKSETQLNLARVSETQAKTEKTGADTLKTIEDAKQKAKETDFISQTSNVTVSI